MEEDEAPPEGECRGAVGGLFPGTEERIKLKCKNAVRPPALKLRPEEFSLELN